ncbi:hypothetical protein [Mycobacteroides chelonae]|uniref:Uncharacterized protein n=1 Tax=Mycobacteroides chelonae TaxID=1774 RepID=A0AB73TY29_MYCCH|nr:hypothetical protein [Mycobacteroides chelonae]QDF69396.1 hypothetical protein FJK96_03885 [Mycobacteroides chelonae]
MADTTGGVEVSAPTQTLTAAAPLQVPELTGFAAGATGAALTAAGVWGLHVLTRGDGVAASAGWAILLVLAFTALGKGITLLRRALAPLSAVVSASVAGIPEPVRAVTGIGVGAAGIWWVLRGHANTWWTQITGTSTGWTLTSGLVQVAIIAVAGALLFGGGKTLATLLFANSGTRQDKEENTPDRWSLWWSSHAGLGLTLLAGAGALVLLSGYVVPRVSGWLTGEDPMAALAAVVAVLTVAFLANTWWWRALSGWWTWAHTPGGPGGPTPLGQIYAGAGVLALIVFSATAFGMATLSSYLPQTAVVASAAPCPPDCGGGGNDGGPQDGGAQFRPPQMPNQMPDYQGGINQPPLDQNGGVSIYNPSSGQAPSQPGGQQSMQEPPFRANPDGSWQARNGEWSPPNYQTATPGLTQGPGQPNPEWPGSQVPQQNPPAQSAQQAPAPQPAQQAPQPPEQPVQQAPQQPAPQQPQPGQQPQPQQIQKQPEQAPPQQPDMPKKSPIDPTDLAVAATRRGSQQAGQQAAQQGTAQAVSKTSQVATQMSGTATNMSGPAPELPAPADPPPVPPPGQPGSPPQGWPAGQWPPGWVNGQPPPGPPYGNPSMSWWNSPNGWVAIQGSPPSPATPPTPGSAPAQSPTSPSPTSPSTSPQQPQVSEVTDQQITEWLQSWRELQTKIDTYNATVPRVSDPQTARIWAAEKEVLDLKKAELIAKGLLLNLQFKEDQFGMVSVIDGRYPS